MIYVEPRPTRACHKTAIITFTPLEMPQPPHLCVHWPLVCYKPSRVNFATISDNRATTRGHGRSPWSSPPHLLALLLLNPGLELICVVNDLMKNLSRDLETSS